MSEEQVSTRSDDIYADRRTTLLGAASLSTVAVPGCFANGGDEADDAADSDDEANETDDPDPTADGESDDSQRSVTFDHRERVRVDEPF